MEAKKWYRKTWAIILLLFVFFPVGLFLMWKYSSWNKVAKVLVSIFVAFAVIVAITDPPEQAPSTPQNSQSAAGDQDADIAPAEESEDDTAPPEEPQGADAEPASNADEQPPAAAPEPVQPTQTIGQKNALKSAESYLAFAAFSHSGLIGQLEYKGYSTEDATYAADNCGADWNEQAAKSAEDYLEFTSFSRSGLIDQLEYEGFTREQAEYGVTAVGY